MAIGNAVMDRRIAVQAPTVTRDDFGSQTTAFATVATIWAAYRPMTATEQAKAGQVAGQMDARFIVRYRQDLDPNKTSGILSYQIVWESNTWDITGVVEIGRRELLEISAKVRSVP